MSWPKYEIEIFHSIPELAKRFVKDVPHVIEAIRTAGIKVIDRATYDGLKIATAGGNLYGIKIEDHCTMIEEARYYPSKFFGDITKNSSQHVKEAAVQALDGVPFVCEPPFTGCEEIGVIEAYHDLLESELKQLQHRAILPVKIKQIRKARKWTQKQLAEHLGVSTSAVQKWEQGQRQVRGAALKILREMQK